MRSSVESPISISISAAGVYSVQCGAVCEAVRMSAPAPAGGCLLGGET